MHDLVTETSFQTFDIEFTRNGPEYISDPRAHIHYMCKRSCYFLGCVACAWQTLLLFWLSFTTVSSICFALASHRYSWVCCSINAPDSPFLQYQLAIVVNLAGVGHVVAAGSDVEKAFALGDRIIGMPWNTKHGQGTWQQFAVIRAADAVSSFWSCV